MYFLHAYFSRPRLSLPAAKPTGGQAERHGATPRPGLIVPGCVVLAQAFHLFGPWVPHLPQGLGNHHT